MKFFFSDHFLLQRSQERKVSKDLAKRIYSKAGKDYFDNVTAHYVAIAMIQHLGKSRTMMLAYDIIGGKIRIIKAYPVREKEIENRIKRKRWVVKNEKN